MQATAAVFREVHQPLTIETIDIDEPRGREVLVRTVATGVCHSDLHIVDGLKLASTSTVPSCLATRAPAWSRPWATMSPPCAKATTSLPVCPASAAIVHSVSAVRPQRRHRRWYRRAGEPDFAKWPVVPAIREYRQLRSPAYAVAREFAGADRSGSRRARPGGAGRMRCADRGRCSVTQQRVTGRSDRRSVRLRRRRAVDRARRADWRRTADHRGGSVRLQTGNGESGRRHPHRQLHPGRRRSKRCVG